MKHKDRVTEITSFKDRLDQKKSSQIKEEFSCDTLFFMRLRATQMSWSEETCGPRTQIQAQPLDGRCGVKCLINSQGHQKPGWFRCSSRSCHLLSHNLSGMSTSQRMSFSSAITGWNSFQSIKRSGVKMSQTPSKSFQHFIMSKAILLSR